MGRVISADVIDRVLAAHLCGDLFPRDPHLAKTFYLSCAKQIHPDVCHDARASPAMEKLNSLYRAAENCFSKRIWQETNADWFEEKGGQTVRVSFLAKDSFELGARYSCRKSAAFLIDESKAKFASAFMEAPNLLKFSGRKMQDEFERFLPIKMSRHILSDGQILQVVQKDELCVPLDLFLEKFGDGLDARHIAWIVSRLNNLTCFLRHGKVSHNAITPSNCFISPVEHTVSLLGGWWYAVRFGQKMMGAPRQVFDAMPILERTNKVGSPVTDLESVKQIARVMMASSDVPPALVKWANSGSSDDALHEYKKWSAALDEAYGERTFTPFTQDVMSVYEH